MSYDDLQYDNLGEYEQPVALLPATLSRWSSRVRRPLTLAVLVVAVVLGVAAACAQEHANKSITSQVREPIASQSPIVALPLETEAPVLHWQPPPFTERKSVSWHTAFNPHVETFGDAYKQLTHSLRISGSDPSVFILPDEGFVLVTRRSVDPNARGIVGRSLTIAVTRHGISSQIQRSQPQKQQLIGHLLPAQIAHLKAGAGTKVYIFLSEHRYERSIDGSAWTLLKSSQTPINTYLRKLNLGYLLAEGR